MRRKVGLFVMVGFVLPLVLAASASGQGAVLEVSPKTARPGEEITVAGRGFSSGTGTSNVFIRLQTRTAPSLRSIAADTAGNINTTFLLPTTLTPGWYLVQGTQTHTPTGRQRAFTPGRARILVQGTPVEPTAAPGGNGGPTSPLALSAVGLALILLLAAASTLIARRRWTPNRPHLGS